MTIENPSKTMHYFIVADASGSMADQIAEVRHEMNKHFEVLKETSEASGNKVKVSLLTFDTDMVWQFQGLEAKDLPHITEAVYRPGGMTALYDAIGQGIHRASYQLGKFDPNREEVWVMVFSDGGENASRGFNHSKLKALLDEYQEKEGWTITFTGCDPEGLKQMNQMNFRADRTRSYLANQKSQIFHDLNETAADWVNRKASGFDFKKPNKNR
ncbi:MAG: VWA domain-containing protein [Bacteroidetes bacterium]|nr:VWA domain-containing protein [Bacteroidota bacterium]